MKKMEKGAAMGVRAMAGVIEGAEKDRYVERMCLA